MECSCASERRIIMSYISKIDPETAGEKEKEVIRNHLAQGYRLTNEKLTLLHNAEAFKAIEDSSYSLDRELQRLIGKEPVTSLNMQFPKKMTAWYAVLISESF